MAPTTTLRVPLYPLELSTPATKCVVTGATGYVASALVKRLLVAGHTVHATVRDPSSSRAAFLKALDGATDRLHLFTADLTDGTSFDPAIAGCTHVFHVASPFTMGVKGKADIQAKLVGPAVSGVESVLGAVDRVGGDTVKTVVVTSSSVGRPYTLDNSKIRKDLGVTFIPGPKSLADMAVKMEEMMKK